MATNDRFNILIVDPDSDSRGKLKQAAMALTTFNKVYVVSKMSEGMQKTTSHETVDVVVMSYRFSDEEIAEFVEKSKSTPRGKEWAYVTVLKSSDQSSETIANNVIGGVDGFLFEPYSADNLREMAEVTAKVKHKNEMSRKKAAIMMMLKEISGHIDAIASFKAMGREPAAALKRLSDSCKNLKKFESGELFDAYLQCASDVFCNAPAPPSANYSGVSQRVRQRLEAKMMKDLETEYDG